MRTEIPTTGQVYANHDALIRRVEKWIGTKNPRIRGCDKIQVRKRIIQRIVELTSHEYTSFSLSRTESPARSSECVIVGGLRLWSSGAVSVSPRISARNMFHFALSWFHLFLRLVLALFRKSVHTPSAATVLMEYGGGYEGSDTRFVQFCTQGSIEPLSVAKHVVVRIKKKPPILADPRFSYTSRPLLYMVNTFLSRSERFSLLLKHLLAPVYYLKALLDCHLSILLGGDLAVLPVVQLMDKLGAIEAIVITTSSFGSQPLWMKGLANQTFKLHMVWYSQNFVPKVYLGEKARSSLPAARHMRVDVHWVWTDGFRKYLESLGQRSEIRVVGPILWYQPEKVPTLDDRCLQVAVFDVTPIEDGKTAFAAAKNYYSVATITKFVRDITDICCDLAVEHNTQIRVYLKPKRRTKEGYHDFGYLRFLHRLEEDVPSFKVIDHQTNLFGLLDQCHLSVSVPYTSTAYVAAAIEKPAVYYDPFAELVPLYEHNKYVQFASGLQELKRIIRKNLSSALRPAGGKVP